MKGREEQLILCLKRVIRRERWYGYISEASIKSVDYPGILIRWFKTQ
jgi:hypothetical protein